MSEQRVLSATSGFMLGETSGTHRVGSSADAADAALGLAEQARHALRLFSRSLDIRVYGSEAFCNAVVALAQRHRYSFIRILVQDPTPAIKANHRLLQPIQQLTSHIGVRRVAGDWQREPSAGLLVDEQGLLRYPNAEYFEATVDFHAGPRAGSYRQWFDQVWAASASDPEFRQLLI